MMGSGHEEDDNSSVDTNDAFMQMLGLSSQVPETLDVEEEEDQIEFPKPLSSSSATAACLVCKPIKLPMKCSRHRIHPSECLALVIDDVMTENQCQRIIQMAGIDRFRYITEATHKTSDGTTSYTVKIQNPNPHKLSAIDTDHDPQITTTTPRSSISSKPTKDAGTLLMDYLYKKIHDTIISDPLFQSFEKRTKCGPMQGLNPRMRVLKYDAKDDDRFDPHFDATTYVVPVPGGGNKSRKKQRKSLITVLLYLNSGNGDDFDGGETFYLDNSKLGEEKNIKFENATKVIPKVGRVVIFEHDLFHSSVPLTHGTKYIMRTDILFEEENENENDNELCIIGNKEVDDGIIDYEQQQTVNNNEISQQQGVLVSDVCDDLDFKSYARNILKEMDVLCITCDSFLAPGAAIMKSMLLDSGLDVHSVEILIKEAEKNQS